MHVFIGLTYYRPYFSGLTIYAERLARALVRRGHRVTVLTARFDKDLLAREICEGVQVIRADVLLRISKGVIMPALPRQAWEIASQADVVNLHAPQLDAALLALISRLKRKPVVLTYHCDLHLPSGLVHSAANLASNFANHISARLANAIVTNTRDYAESSPFLQAYLEKVHPILPPVELAQVSEADIRDFRVKAGIQPGQRIIGMAARLASEKGVEYLVQALPAVLEKYPHARVLFVGQYENVLGEQDYAHKLAPLIQELGDHWTFLGILTQVELAAFFREAELTILPSINSTESFGMVQVESMSCGTPVIASNLPGVRVPVQITGMGRIVPPRDAGVLAQAIIDLLDQRGDLPQDLQGIANRFSPGAVAAQYEKLFDELLSEHS
ncbi:MAG: glycosyltransferase family 4 protein [Anaerolineales bacterium]